MNTGATVICSRSSRLASRNADTVTPPLAQVGQHVRHVRTAISRFVDPDDGGRADVRLARADACPAAEIQRGRGLVHEDPRRRRQAALRIHDGPKRAGARHSAGRQLRVVSSHGAGTDDYHIAKSTETMHVNQVVVAGNELRVA
jgi:hypothetical protein